MTSTTRGALDEIDELTQLNRKQRNAAREARLVERRNAAFEELDRTPGRPSWPPDLADPFPGSTGIPTVDPGQVSAATIGGGILHHGCVRVNGLLDPQTATRFRELIEAAFSARQRIVDGDPVEAAAPWYVPFAKGVENATGFGSKRFVRAVDVPHALFELAEAFERTGVRKAVEEYFNERPAMIANKWVLRRSPSGVDNTDYHQDGAFLGDAIRTVDCWIALSDCGPGTGRPAMDVVPRRFEIIAPGQDGATFPWSVAAATVERLAGSTSIASPSLRGGRCVVLRRAAPPPHERRHGSHHPLRHRIVVRRAVVVSGQARAGRALNAAPSSSHHPCVVGARCASPGDGQRASDLTTKVGLT